MCNAAYLLPGLECDCNPFYDPWREPEPYHELPFADRGSGSDTVPSDNKECI